MTNSYEALLKSAYSNITEPSGDDGRFQVPKSRVFVEGKTTVLENFTEIVSTLRREPDQVMKFMMGELGTSGKIEGTRAVFNGKFEKQFIADIIEKYTADYVICSECGKPDTQLVKDGRVTLLRCDACGGHRPIRKRRVKAEKPPALEEGKEYDVTIQAISRRGDGVAKIDKYTIYVPKVQKGMQVKIKITRISGSIGFCTVV